MSNQAIHVILKSNPLVPVVTFRKGDNPIELMEYLLKRNIFCIEVTLRTPYGLPAIERLKNHYNDTVSIGAGTVIHATQIEQLVSVGTDFMVSPGLTPALFECMNQSSIPFLPGVSTPSEVIQAQELGLKYLKFFPANLYGGIDAIKTFGGLFPELKFCPTGGITESTSHEYLKQNNVVAVGGSWFQKEFNSSSR